MPVREGTGWIVQDDDINLLEIMARHIDAWNRHDIDGLMTLVADDRVFVASGGPEACGTRWTGAAAVREAFLDVFATLPDEHWGHGRHHALGPADGVSEWTLTGTLADGRRLEVNGCDFLTVRDGRIVRKNCVSQAAAAVLGEVTHRNLTNGQADQDQDDGQSLRRHRPAVARPPLPGMSPESTWG